MTGNPYRLAIWLQPSLFPTPLVSGRQDQCILLYIIARTLMWLKLLCRKYKSDKFSEIICLPLDLADTIYKERYIIAINLTKCHITCSPASLKVLQFTEFLLHFQIFPLKNFFFNKNMQGQAGTAKDKTGTTRDKTGIARDKIGTARDETGTSRDKTGTGA